MIQLKHHQWTGPSAWWKPSVWVSSGLWGHPAQGWALIRHPETVWLQVYSFVRDRSSSQWTGAHTCSRVSFLLQLWEQNFTSACWRPQTVTAPVCPLMRFSRFYCFWWFYIFFCFKRFSVVFVVYGVFFIILLFLFLFIILFFLLFFLLLFLMVLLLDSDKWRDVTWWHHFLPCCLSPDSSLQKVYDVASEALPPHQELPSDWWFVFSLQPPLSFVKTSWRHCRKWRRSGAEADSENLSWATFFPPPSSFCGSSLGFSPEPLSLLLRSRRRKRAGGTSGSFPGELTWVWFVGTLPVTSAATR